jgi:hypothetical protein
MHKPSSTTRRIAAAVTILAAASLVVSSPLTIEAKVKGGPTACPPGQYYLMCPLTAAQDL